LIGTAFSPFSSLLAGYSYSGRFFPPRHLPGVNFPRFFCLLGLILICSVLASRSGPSSARVLPDQLFLSFLSHGLARSSPIFLVFDLSLILHPFWELPNSNGSAVSWFIGFPRTSIFFFNFFRAYASSLLPLRVSLARPSFFSSGRYRYLHLIL